MKVYLCGPIKDRTDADCKDWRENFKALWDGECLDPMSRDYRGKEMDPGNMRQIVIQDKADINAVDGLVVWFDQPSVGTSMEVLYAWERNKKVVVVNRSGKTPSVWLIYHSHAVVNTLEEAVIKLHQLL